MPRYPAATWRPITRNHGGRRSRTRAVVLHVDAGGANSLYGWFQNPAAQASSHFYVTYDGRVEQYLDTDLTAWTQREGNSSCIGIETQGLGDGAWTQAQLDAIVALLAWVCDTHKIPRRDMGSSLPGASGIGIHRYGIDPYRRPGAETWGPHAKACPGDARVAQLPGIIARLTTSTTIPAPSTDWIDMATQQDLINAVGTALLGVRVEDRNVFDWLKQIRAEQAQTLGRVAGLEKLVAAESDLTVEQVREASRQGVADALGDIETTVTVKAVGA